jgi:hypothetical protein
MSEDRQIQRAIASQTHKVIFSRNESRGDQNRRGRLEGAVTIPQLHRHRIGGVNRSSQVQFSIAVYIRQRSPDWKAVCACAGCHLRQQRGDRRGSTSVTGAVTGLPEVRSVKAS